MLGGGAGDRGDQPRVVDQLTVVGEQAAARGRRGARWAPSRRRALAAMRRDRGSVDDGVPASLRSASPASEAGAHQRPRRCAHRGQQRNQLRHGADEVRSVARHQDSAFDGAAPGDADVAGRQVAQAAVHQLGAPPAGAEREVVLLHQRDAQPAGRGVQRDAGAGDAAADHDRRRAARRRPAPPARRARRAALRAVELGHGFRYPFSEWASSTSSASASRIGATICADWIVDWAISRHMAASWRGSPARTLPSSWASLQLGGQRVDEDLLAGAEPLGDVDHRQLGGAVQHRHDHFVVARAVRRPRRSARPALRGRPRGVGTSRPARRRSARSAAPRASTRMSGQRR